MIIPLISSILIVVGIAATLYLAYSLFKNPPASSEAAWLSKAQFGEFEERLRSLREVIVFADEIEVPTKENAREVLFALLDNFSEGVIYTFVVPQNFHSTHSQEIYRRYNAIRMLANELTGTCPSDKLIQLSAWEKPLDEPDYPYVFYRYETSPRQQNLWVVGGSGRSPRV